MLSKLRQLGQLHPLIFLGCGSGFMVIAVVLISAHIQTITEVRDVSVPIVAKLPQLERQLYTLKEQVELTELHTATRTGSQQERVEVYALPKKTDVSRLVATFEVIRDVLSRNGLLADMSDIDISEPYEHETGAQVRKVSVEFAVHEDGLRTIVLITRLAGLLTVGDVLTSDDVDLLVTRVEQENPTGIIALEQFLSTDFLRYIEQPRTFEEQLKRSFSTAKFHNAFENVLRTSLLYDAKLLLGSELGEVLQRYKLWPLQIMAMEEVSIRPGSAAKWHRLGLTVLVFSEES